MSRFTNTLEKPNILWHCIDYFRFTFCFKNSHDCMEAKIGGDETRCLNDDNLWQSQQFISKFILIVLI